MVNGSFLRVLALTALLAICGAGCTNAANTNSAGNGDPEVMFVNVTHGGWSAEEGVTGEVDQVDMALTLAGFGLDEERSVVLFFNVTGVRVPTRDFPADTPSEVSSVAAKLAALIERGADVHVCPICMKKFGVDEKDLVEGAKVTTRDSLFANIGGNTAVFTY